MEHAIYYTRATHFILAICSLAVLETPKIHTEKAWEFLFLKALSVHAVQWQVRRSVFCKSQISTADQNFRN